MTGSVATSGAGSTVKEAIIVIGPLPPPYHGCAVATQYVLASELRDDWQVVHLDTADRRGVDNIGRFDVMNVVLALRHFVEFLVLLGRWRPAVVYVPIAQNTLGVLRDMLFMVPALSLRRRLIVHVHGGGFGVFYENAGSAMRWMVRNVVGRADRVIVLGEVLRGTLDGIVRTERVCVVPNGMPDPFITPPRRAAGGPFRVLYLGNLIRSKGFVEVLEAARLLAGRGVDVILDMAGGWAGEAERSAAAPHIEALGNRVIMHGPVDSDRKLELLAAADVLAFPTYYEFEGHPLVVLEAMSAALPVATTRHAAIPETVIDGETGVLVPARDPAALADALERLARDNVFRDRLGRASRERYLKQYSMSTWSGRLTDVFRSVAA